MTGHHSSAGIDRINFGLLELEGGEGSHIFALTTSVLLGQFLHLLLQFTLDFRCSIN